MIHPKTAGLGRAGGVLKHKKVRPRQGNKSLASIRYRRIVSLSLAR